MLSVITALVVIAATFIYWYRRDPRLPPGPRGLPFFGVIPLLGRDPSKTLTEWGKVYGGVFTARFGQYDTVVITDYEIRYDVQIKQGAKMGGRYPMYIYLKCTQAGGLFSATPELSEIHRPFTLHALRRMGVGSKTLEKIIQEESDYLMEAFRERAGSPFDPKSLFLSAAINISTLISLGERFSYDDDKVKEIGWRLVRGLQEDGFYMGLSTYCEYLTSFPPFSSAMKRFVKDFDFIVDYCEEKVREHEKTYDENEIRDYVDIFLEEMKKDNPDPSFNIRQLTLALHDLLDAGAETLCCTLVTSMIALVQYPECQSKLREEVDKIVGERKQVSMSDRIDMPYTQAFIHELMRRCTMVRLTSIRTVLDGVQVQNYSLPKHTPMIGVTWAIHSNPEYFENPNEFRPERFINPADGSFQKSKYWIPFGIGKRNCLGEQLAQMEFFIILVNLVQQFEFSVKDKKKCPTLDDGEQGIVFVPHPMDLIVTERA